MLTTSLAAATAATTVGAAEERFDVGLRLIVPAFVSQDSNLQFPEQIAGNAAQLVITPDGNGAAQFITTGEPLRAITASIVEPSIVMEIGEGGTPASQIVVNNFTLGGSVDANGAGSLNSEGILGNIRVGATANIAAENQSGNYVGVATFRIIYA